MAAATNTKKKQQQPAPAVDPKFEWADKAGSYVLRLSLDGFKKGDFRVQVDGAGRLTVSGARPGATPGSLHKVFQLPSTASLDDIAGRFEASVLTLTVPKRAYSGVPAPTSVEEIKRNKPGVAKDDGATTATVRPPPGKDVAGGEKKAASGDDSMKPKTKPKEEIAKEEDVPKRAYSGVPAPTSVEEIKRDKPGVAKDDGATTATVRPPPGKDVAGGEKKAASGDDSMKPKTKPKEEIAKEEDVPKKAVDEATKKAQQQKQHEETSKHKEEQQKLAPEPEAKKEQEVKPKAPQPQAAATAAPEKPAPKSEVAIGEKDKAVVDQESPAAGVRRRSEEEKAKAAAAAMEAKGVLEKKATACSGWKERVAGGLEQLTDMKWADSMVEKARNNKEVVAIAIAAFSLGFFVSHKLFRK